MEKVGENYLEKTMNHFALPFLYEGSDARQASGQSLVEFSKGCGESGEKHGGAGVSDGIDDR